MKLYVVRHFIKAGSLKEAIKHAKNREPDEAYISDEWNNKVGWIESTDKDVKGFVRK